MTHISQASKKRYLKAFEIANNRRYYLHKRLKLKGIFVNAYEGIIELDPNQVKNSNEKKTILYLNDLKNNFNYLTQTVIQTVIMKANNKIADPDIKKDQIEKPAEKKIVEQGKPLISIAVLKPKFGDLTTEIEQYKKYSEDVVVDSGTSLTIAENNVGLINDALKNIEKVRKVIKDPYMQSGKLVDEYAKTLGKPLDEAKKLISEVVTNYKNIQSAAARAEAERVRKEVELLADEKAAEADKLNRIQTQLIARIYGGHWFNKEKQRKTTAGCQTSFEGKSLIKAIKEKLPSPDTFTHLHDEYKVMINEMQKKLSKHIANLLEKESDSSVLTENAEKEIEDAKAVAIIKANDKKEELAQDIIKDARKDIGTANAEIKEAGKGIRKNLKFEVTEMKSVPEEWLKINEVAIREWALENKKEVTRLIKEENGIYKGIKFFLEQSYVSR